MKRFRGIIALDIDGTLTIEKHILEDSVSDFLNTLIYENWLLVFLTGRTFSFAKSLLSNIKGKYFFAVQNGAALYQMPEAKLLKKNYLSCRFLPDLDAIFLNEEGGLLVESGKENGDFCFFKPQDFTDKEMEYIHFRMGISPEKWVAINSFDGLQFSEFAVGKYFAEKETADAIAKKIHNVSPNSFNIVVIRDPFRTGWHLAHVSDKKASKGEALSELTHLGDIAIAAGDDYNDVDMLKRAKVKIVMENAPLMIRKMADIIAPSAKKQGIILGLKEAIAKWKD